MRLLLDRCGNVDGLNGCDNSLDDCDFVIILLILLFLL